MNDNLKRKNVFMTPEYDKNNGGDGRSSSSCEGTYEQERKLFQYNLLCSIRAVSAHLDLPRSTVSHILHEKLFFSIQA